LDGAASAAAALSRGDEGGGTFDGGTTVDYQRPPPRGLGVPGGDGGGPLSQLRRVLALFPILRVVGNLALYVLATGVLYAHLEGLSAIDGMYYAVNTHTHTRRNNGTVLFLSHTTEYSSKNCAVKRNNFC
jgi:hypothetical protein